MQFWMHWYRPVRLTSYARAGVTAKATEHRAMLMTVFMACSYRLIAGSPINPSFESYLPTSNRRNPAYRLAALRDAPTGFTINGR
jgi:hypothetical protein